ncbi:MAG: hypothetical protein KKI08_27165 [Armatimonadetes bacterium]|nr:hypothetical protein [Armatimonadota bacterium]
MSDITLTIKLSDEKLSRLRECYPGMDVGTALERLLDERIERERDQAEHERGWAALDALIGLVHGDGTAGSDAHDKWGLGTDE